MTSPDTETCPIRDEEFGNRHMDFFAGNKRLKSGAVDYTVYYLKCGKCGSVIEKKSGT